MTFKDDFLGKYKQPGPERENFIFTSITSRIPKSQIVASLKPLTITRPDGAKVTIKVLPDYLMLDGMRVPVAGLTAQRIAGFYGLLQPTPAMSQDIYNNADHKVEAKPLSGSGTTVDGKEYSGQAVVDKGVGYAPFVANYSEKVDRQLKEKGVQEGQIVAGFAKDVTTPPKGAEGNLALHGFYDKDGKPIQGGNGKTPHDTQYHSEYGSYLRLVSPEAVITYPDGRTEQVATSKVYEYNLYKDKSGTKPPVTPSKGGSQVPLSGSAVADKDKPSSTSSSAIAKTDKTKKPTIKDESPTEVASATSTRDPFSQIDDILKSVRATIQYRREKILKRGFKNLI